LIPLINDLSKVNFYDDLFNIEL